MKRRIIEEGSNLRTNDRRIIASKSWSLLVKEISSNFRPTEKKFKHKENKIRVIYSTSYKNTL